MAYEQIAGITVLIVLGLMLAGAIKVFGFARVMLAIAALVLMAFTIAFRTLNGATGRRY